MSNMKEYMVKSMVEGYNLASSELERKWAKVLINQAIRRLDAIGTPFMSKGLHDAIVENGGDPLEVIDGDYNHVSYRLAKLIGKGGYVHEHATPLSESVDKLIHGESWDVVDSDRPTIWILKSEDDTLRDLGLRTKRPHGWRKAYEEASIEVLTLKD